MRLFIAVPVDPVRGSIGEIIDDLRASNADCRWVKPDNLHLTIQFLGETSEDRLEAVAAAMAEACRERAGFDVRFGGPEAFPSMARPRVIWIGLSEGAQQLKDMAGCLSAALTGRGLVLQDEGREFKAHLTIGRIKGPRDLARLRTRVAGWTPERMGLSAVRADRIVLYQSRLAPGGSVYAALRTEAFTSPP